MKLPFVVLLFLMTIGASAQSNLFIPSDAIHQTEITTRQDTLPVRSLEALGKLSLSYQSVKVGLPSGYNWTRDFRMREASERMAGENRQQDSNGRDIIQDIDRQMTARLVNKYLR